LLNYLNFELFRGGWYRSFNSCKMLWNGNSNAAAAVAVAMVVVTRTCKKCASPLFFFVD
jgi:hypothetical protein